MKILIFGASGMLGSAIIRVLSDSNEYEVFGTIRSSENKQFLPKKVAKQLILGVDAENHDALVKVFRQVRPDLVINCIGLIKQLADSKDPLLTIPVNSLLPHRLAKLCEIANARLIHISTDCVFDGKKGGYIENDQANATDLYGISKYLGEVCYPHTITLRTSIIGHELNSTNGLVDWLLKQQTQCRGYTKAVFSGLPTVVLAQIIRDIVIPNETLQGLYHLAAQPITKFELLRLVAEVYGKKIDIIADDSLVIDRSLNANLFHAATGYIVPEWPELIRCMHSYYQS